VLESLEITAGYPVFRPRPVFLDRGEIAVSVDMACATTVSQFACGVLDIRIFALLVWTRLVVTRMTASTIRLECSIAPGNKFRVALVALCAT